MATNQTRRSLISYQYNAILAALALLAANQMLISSDIDNTNSILSQILESLDSGGPIGNLLSEIESTVVDQLVSNALTQNEQTRGIGNTVSTLRELQSLISAILPSASRPTKEQIDEVIFELTDLNCAIHRCASYDDDTFGEVVPAFKDLTQEFSSALSQKLLAIRYKRNLDYTAWHRNLILAEVEDGQTDGFYCACINSGEYTPPLVSTCSEEECYLPTDYEPSDSVDSRIAECGSNQVYCFGFSTTVSFISFDPYTIPSLRDLGFEMPASDYKDIIFIGSQKPSPLNPSTTRYQFLFCDLACFLTTCDSGSCSEPANFPLTSQLVGYFLFLPIHLKLGPNVYTPSIKFSEVDFHCDNTRNRISYATAELLKISGICNTMSNVTIQIKQQNSLTNEFQETIRGARSGFIRSSLGSALNSDFSNVTFGSTTTQLFYGDPDQKGLSSDFSFYRLPPKIYSYAFYVIHAAVILSKFETVPLPGKNLVFHLPGNNTKTHHLVCSMFGGDVVAPNACFQFMQSIQFGEFDMLGDSLVVYMFIAPEGYALTLNGDRPGGKNGDPAFCDFGISLYNDFVGCDGVKASCGSCSSSYYSTGSYQSNTINLLNSISSFGTGQFIIFDSLPFDDDSFVLRSVCCSGDPFGNSFINEVASSTDARAVDCDYQQTYYSTCGNPAHAIYERYNVFVTTYHHASSAPYSDSSIQPAAEVISQIITLAINNN